MKYFIVTILITITACSHRQLPHNQPLHRDVVADIINKSEYFSQDNEPVNLFPVNHVVEGE
jgi:hypothetical protein